MEGPRPISRLARRLTALAACVTAAAVAAPAALAADAATAPDVRWPAGGVTIRTAMDIATGYWAATPCQGQVDVGWDSLGRRRNANSSWSNDFGEAGDPALNTECEIALNRQTDWDWPKLCTVIVHEVGHLTGHEHSDDPRDVMYPVYVGPVDACALAVEPAEPAAAPAPPPLTATPAPAAPRAKAKPPARRTAAKGKRAPRAKRPGKARGAGAARHR